MEPEPSKRRGGAVDDRLSTALLHPGSLVQPRPALESNIGSRGLRSMQQCLSTCTPASSATWSVVSRSASGAMPPVAGSCVTVPMLGPDSAVRKFTDKSGHLHLMVGV